MARVVRTFVLNRVDPPRAVLRLLILPHAGAGGSSGLLFGNHAPDDWLIATARLPGRESRVGEPIGGMPGLVADATGTIRGLPGTAPLLVLGVCSGGVIAFEAVRELQRAGSDVVSGVVVAAQGVPDKAFRPPVRPPTEPGAEADVLGFLRRNSGLPSTVADNESLLAALLPGIAADFQAVAHHHPAPAPPLRCPLLTVAGNQDGLCPESRMAGWSAYAPRSRHVRISGGHMLLTEHPKKLAGAVEANLDLFGLR
ncbi:thioesterase II family protein [Streptomyces tsukubensis]|uniref:thioesterase II family protein n=1 Tax=Streptomyces tsukubensis TaxID=83656 RepID=UPI00368D8CED